MKTAQLTRVICSDYDYDQLCADIYLGEKFICRLSWERGPKAGQIEFHSFQDSSVSLNATQFTSFLVESFKDLTASKMNAKLIDTPEQPRAPLKLSLEVVEKGEVRVLFGEEIGSKIQGLENGVIQLMLCNLSYLNEWCVNYFEFTQILRDACAKI